MPLLVSDFGCGMRLKQVLNVLDQFQPLQARQFNQKLTIVQLLLKIPSNYPKWYCLRLTEKRCSGTECLVLDLRQKTS
jgi:hypothetical protein